METEGLNQVERLILAEMKDAGCLLFVDVYGTHPELSLVEQGQNVLLRSFERLSAESIKNESGQDQWSPQRKPQFLKIESAPVDLCSNRGPQDHLLGFAFLEPPKGLDDCKLKSFKNSLELFKAFCYHFLDEPGQSQILITWQTDWARFFDVGRKPWGRFCWTLHHQTRVTAMFAAASTP